MANIIELNTENKLEYHFFPVSSGSVQFKVKAPNDAHIALTTGPQESDPMIEVFIGGWVNTKSVIRRNRTKPDKVEIYQPGIMNADEFRGFWIHWNRGIISAGREGVAIPFISWTDSSLFPINFVGVCTGWGATGSWEIEVPPFLEKPILKPIVNGDLHWVQVNSETSLPVDALIGGFEEDRLYIIRAPHRGSLTPGKYVSSEGVGYIPWGGDEHEKDSFEVLCGFDCTWVPTSQDNIPVGAVLGGVNNHREKLFIGRVQYMGHIIPGKVTPSHKVCYISYKGNEIAQEKFEILVHPNTMHTAYKLLVPHIDVKC